MNKLIIAVTFLFLVHLSYGQIDTINQQHGRTLTKVSPIYTGGSAQFGNADGDDTTVINGITIINIPQGKKLQVNSEYGTLVMDSNQFSLIVIRGGDTSQFAINDSLVVAFLYQKDNRGGAIALTKGFNAMTKALPDGRVLAIYQSQGMDVASDGIHMLIDSGGIGGGAASILSISAETYEITFGQLAGGRNRTLIVDDEGKLIANPHLILTDTLVDLTAGVATVIDSFTVPNNTVAGGLLIVTGEANDGTEFQAETNVISYTVVNKAGTLTITTVNNTPAEAGSAGLTTQVVSLTDGGSGVVRINVQATSTLAETTLRATCQRIQNF